MFALYTFRLKWNGIIWCSAAIDVGPIGCFTFMWLFLRSIDIVCKWAPKPSYCNKLWIICTYLATVRCARLLNENEEIIVIISMRNVFSKLCCIIRDLWCCLLRCYRKNILYCYSAKSLCEKHSTNKQVLCSYLCINLDLTKVLQQLAGAIQSKSI